MTPEIKSAYTAWQAAESKIPDEEYEKGYKSRSATARKLYNTFRSLCISEGLNPLQAAAELHGDTTFSVK